jgi:hypothetical protein
MRALILVASIGLLAAGCGATASPPTQVQGSAGAPAPIIEGSYGWKSNDKGVPAAGGIWFGKEMDPSAFVLTGDPITTTSMFARVVLVAHFRHPVADGAQLIIRTADRSTPFTYGADGDLFSFSLTAGELLASTTGEKTVEILDADSNVLATGPLTVTE